MGGLDSPHSKNLYSPILTFFRTVTCFFQVGRDFFSFPGGGVGGCVLGRFLTPRVGSNTFLTGVFFGGAGTDGTVLTRFYL